MSPNRSVYNRFVYGLLAMLAIVFALAITAYESNNYARSEQVLSERLDQTFETYRLLYAEPLANNDQELIDAYTAPLLSNGDLARLVLRNSRGDIVKQYDSGDGASDLFTRKTSISYGRDYRARTVGSLEIDFSPRTLIKEFKRRVRDELILLAALIALVWISAMLAFKRSFSRSLQELDYHANHDELTKLMNRRSFMNVLEIVSSSKEWETKNKVLAFLDLDDFKIINDRFGHDAGDRVLKGIAALMKSVVREGDIVARFGGDEFALLLLNCNLENGGRICKKIRDQIVKQTEQSKGGVSVGISVGVVDLTGNCDLEERLRRADEACYEAKSRGKNTVILSESGRVQSL